MELPRMANPLILMVRPERFELPTYGFVVRCAIRCAMGAHKRKVQGTRFKVHGLEKLASSHFENILNALEILW